jgi:ADP-ribose pyrophosphatase YjhB (NUDIX family)
LENQKKNFYLETERLLVAVDCIIFGFEEERLKLLLFKRKIKPFENEWSLIGSFLNVNESIDAAAKRVLKESTGLNNVYLEASKNYGAVNRDAGGRVVSLAHYALIRIEEQEKKLTTTHQAHWFDIDTIPALILDHNEMVEDALEKLRRKARYQLLGFELLPKRFTIPQLKKLYDAIYQKDLDRRNFRKRILSMNILKKLTEKDKSTSKKGAYLYEFDKEKYEQLMKEGFNFEL